MPVVDPMTHVNAAGHDTTDRSVLAATLIALDHVPAGPAVVDVVACGAVVVVGALDDPGLWLHAAASSDSATTASAAVNGPARLGTYEWTGRPFASRAR
jgi:hypothetical protein